MGRKKIAIDPECGMRLKELLIRNEMTQETLAGKINYSQKHISSVVCGRKRLTPDLANLIIEVFPEVDVNWLLNKSPYMIAGVREQFELLKSQQREEKRERSQSYRLMRFMRFLKYMQNGSDYKLEFPESFLDEDVCEKGLDSSEKILVLHRNTHDFRGAREVIGYITDKDLKKFESHVEAYTRFLLSTVLEDIIKPL